MGRSPKLNDLQLILLTTAAQREDGSILPPPEHLSDQGERIRKAIPPLLRKKLVEEMTGTDRQKLWREEGDRLIGLVITEAGRAIIGVQDEQPTSPAEVGADKNAEAPPTGRAQNRREASAREKRSAAPAPRLPRSGTKAELVLTLLRRPEGVTLSELVSATDWLPHTTRAALTGLRKKGHSIERTRQNEQTCYRLGAAV